MFDIQNEITALLKREGGYVNHQSDRGGPTNMGITLNTLSEWLGRPASLDDVKNLHEQTARDIYYSLYYIKNHINKLPDLIKPVVFDSVIHCGRRGIKILQEALTCYNYETGKIDGIIGPRTIAAAEKASADMGNKLITTLVRRRIIFYESIVKRNESLRQFLSGWIKRAEYFNLTPQ